MHYVFKQFPLSFSCVLFCFLFFMIHINIIFYKVKDFKLKVATVRKNENHFKKIV